MLAILFRPLCKIIPFSLVGGSYGTVSIAVKSIGGGEPWDYDVAITPASTSETIGQALSNRDNTKAAAEGEDYARLNEIITFQVWW